MRQLADAQGNIVQRYDYSPFGEVVAAQGARSSKLQYTGEQTDNNTGLIYLRARWYDPATGRFTSRDPFRGIAGLPQSQHPYAYAHNNPINLTDPSGEFIETPWDILMVGLDFGILVGDALYYLFTPCDPLERARVLGQDLLFLGTDAALALIPGAPGGARLAGEGVLAFVRGGITTGQAVLKGVQIGTYLARTSGGSSGRGGRSSSGRSLTPDEITHTRRISKVDAETYISKHPAALTEPPGGPHVLETQQLINRLSKSVDTLRMALPYLDDAASTQVRATILEGEQKLNRLTTWFGRR